MKEPFFSPRNYSADVFYVPGDEDIPMLGSMVDSPEELIYRVVDWVGTSYTDDDGDDVMIFIPVCLRVDPAELTRCLMPAIPMRHPGVICFSLKDAVIAATASWERLQRERDEFTEGITAIGDSAPEAD
jgi:hypothetical protein